MAQQAITRKRLEDWAGKQIVDDAERLLAKGQVLNAERDGDDITGRIIAGSRTLKTGVTLLQDGTIESHCPCYDNRERGMICVHVMALALTLVKRATDPEREAKYQAEMRKASRLSSIAEEAYIQRAGPDTPGALPASIVISLGPDWQAGFQRGATPVICEAEYHGHRQRLDNVSREAPLALEKEDEALLFVLEDIAEGPARGEMALSQRDFLNLVSLCRGRALEQAEGAPITVNSAPMDTVLRVDLDRENGELIVIAHTELPFMRPGEFPFYLASGRAGWVYGAANLWPLDEVLPEPYHPIYAEPVIIPRHDVLRFFKQELPLLETHATVESDLTLDLFSIEPATPVMILRVKGSPASLAAILYAAYGDTELVAAKPDARGDFCLPDPDDLLGYRVRHTAREAQALVHLRQSGLVGECGDDLASIVGEHAVLNFLGSHLPALRRLGWRVELEGRVAPYMEDMEFATPVVQINDGDGWFDVGFDFEDAQGASLSAADIQLAIRKGESYIRRNGRTILVDSEAIESVQDVFGDCASGEGHGAGTFRMSNLYAGFVKSSLDALDGVDVEDTPAWRKRSGQANRNMTLQPVELDEPLASTLRPYQKTGVEWLRFMEENQFCGLLADEMGLGKTLQTLTWLNLERTADGAAGKPALIVCPTSLVYNWAEEAARFVPHLKVLALTGSDRHEKWKDVPDSDLVITSYALLRRDLDRLLEQEFSAMVLDEAQHIKNKATQNAVAAKQMKAGHKLVLTGTPIENSVMDLWSIMDFLMPGYLGSHEAFKVNYERRIERGGEEAESAQRKLRRKLQPFLLRRLKTAVAKDLPDKIEKISHCDMTPDQQVVYRELLEASRRKIQDMVKQKGFNKCRMEILTTLMRLRQVCCHLDLLKLPDLKAKKPSGKMDLFLELVDEAVDGGHRILVFSQFVSMLKILRGELDKRGMACCYLDGSTKNRMDVVHRFNSQRDIPIFLISLKAGGTGLNLTGADMVVHFDPWWNPAVEDQATDRAHRIGQKRTVYSIKMITRDTVEEKVLALQRKKKAVINATVESDQQMMQSLSWDDVQDLLSL